MEQAITLRLPDETLQRYRRGAAAARKLLDEFLVERLTDVAPPLADDLPSPMREELRAMEDLSDEALWQETTSRMPLARQRTYSRLLGKNRKETITAREKETLRALGDQARRLTLRKAHAYMLLKWRGHRLPSIEELPETT